MMGDGLFYFLWHCSPELGVPYSEFASFAVNGGKCSSWFEPDEVVLLGYLRLGLSLFFTMVGTESSSDDLGFFLRTACVGTGVPWGSQESPTSVPDFVESRT
jgi:hypothetical protein